MWRFYAPSNYEYESERDPSAAPQQIKMGKQIMRHNYQITTQTMPTLIKTPLNDDVNSSHNYSVAINLITTVITFAIRQLCMENIKIFAEFKFIGNLI